MITKHDNGRITSTVVCLDDLVQRFHLLRKIESRVDWDMIYTISIRR